MPMSPLMTIPKGKKTVHEFILNQSIPQYKTQSAGVLYTNSFLNKWNRHCQNTVSEIGETFHDVPVEQQSCPTAEAVQMVKLHTLPDGLWSLAETHSLRAPDQPETPQHRTPQGFNPAGNLTGWEKEHASSKLEWDDAVAHLRTPVQT